MNNMDQMLQEAMTELAELDVFLSKTLEYTAVIDESFKNVSSQFGEIKERTLSFVVDHKKDLFSSKKEAEETINNLAMLSEGVELGIRGAGELYKRYKQQQALNILLKLKQEIATEKCEVVKQILERSVKNVLRFEGFVKLYAQQTYSLDRVEDWESQKTQMVSLMSQYRMSYYIYLSLSFLIEEYNAWLNGQHDSEIDSPTFLDVNEKIVNVILFPKKNTDNNESKDINEELRELVKENPILTGRILFIMVDDSLMAFYLAYRENIIYMASQLESGNIPNSQMRSLLQNNSAFEKTLTAYRQYYHIQQKGDGTTKIYIFSALLAAAITAGSVYCEDTWVKIILLVISFFVIIYTTLKRVKKAKQKFQNALDTVIFEVRNKMLLHAGDDIRKQKVKDTIKGSPVWGAIIGAIIGFFFIPIPGGLILGLLGGAYLGSSTD